MKKNGKHQEVINWIIFLGIEKKEIDDKESLTSQIKMNDREISGFRITMLSPDDNK